MKIKLASKIVIVTIVFNLVVACKTEQTDNNVQSMVSYNEEFVKNQAQLVSEQAVKQASVNKTLHAVEEKPDSNRSVNNNQNTSK